MSTLKTNQIQTTGGKVILNSTGGVLQIVQSTDGSQTAGTNVDTTKLSTSITLSSSSNKVLVMASIFAAHDNGNGYWTLRRNGSELNTSIRMFIEDALPANTYEVFNAKLVAYDSPGTTNPTYDVFYNHNTKNGGTTYFNRGRTISGVCYSNIILMEIT